MPTQKGENLNPELKTLPDLNFDIKIGTYGHIRAERLMHDASGNVLYPNTLLLAQARCSAFSIIEALWNEYVEVHPNCSPKEIRDFAVMILKVLQSNTPQ